MSIHQTIREGRQRLGLTEQQFAQKVGVSRAAVQQWEREGGTAPRRANQQAVAALLGLTVAQLIGGRESNVEAGPELKNKKGYPLISWVQAGEWTDICDNFQPGDAEEWRDCHKDLGEHGYVLRVVGDSMTAPAGSPYSFPNGMLLYVKPDAEAIAGKFVVVRRSGEGQATFKRLTLVDGELFLEAINPSWPNRYLKLKDGDHISGVVMHAGFDLP